MTPYIPPKVQKCGNELRVHKNPALALATLRRIYPNIMSYQTAVNHLKLYLTSTDEHHPDYNSRVKALEDEFVSLYTKSLGQDGTLPGDDNILQCVRFLYDFKSVPVKRQLQVLHKVRKGEMRLPHQEFQTKLLGLPILPEYTAALQVTREEAGEVKSKLSVAQSKRSCNVVKISNPNELVDFCNNVIRNSRGHPLSVVCVAVALLTGRRTVEILLTGSLVPTSSSKYFTYFSGQAKTGLRNIKSVKGDTPSSYIIPVLGCARTLTAVVQELQESVKKELGEVESRDVINRHFAHKLSRAVKKVVGQDVRFHDLRTLYALITFEAFKPHSYGLNGWVSRVLGHAEEKMSTHYTRMQIGRVSHIGNVVPEF